MPTKTVPALDIPANLLPAENTAGAYRSLVARAFRENLKCLDLDDSTVQKLSLFIHPPLDKKIQKMADTLNRSYQSVFLGLTAAAISHLEQERAVFANTPTSQAPFKSPRPEQLRFYQNIQKALDNQKICMAEASTGVGKSRAMLAAAITASQNRVCPIVVTAPTLKVLGQLWEELEKLQAEGLGTMLKCTFFPGSGEFVNSQKLLAYLNATKLGIKDAPFDEAVAEWAAKGGPCISDTPLVRAMNGHAEKLKWLMEDLRTLATDLSPEDFAIDPQDKETEEMAQLLDVRAANSDADIIFCTHTMIGRAAQSQWSLFPSPQAIIVDEAHLFEANIAAIHTARVSLHSLRYRLNAHVKAGNKSKAATTAIGAVSTLIACLKDLDTDSSTVSTILTAKKHADLIPLVGQIVAALHAKKLASADIPLLKSDTKVLSTLENVLLGKCSDRAFLEFSPDRRFPSIMAGAADIGRFLGSMWKQAFHGVILASATLYTMDEFGNSKCDYLAKNLAIPMSRIDTPTPVIASWTIRNATIHLPDAQKCARLARPAAKARTMKEEASWLEFLGAEIVPVVQNAKGGTLVLATSYFQVEGISQILKNLSIPEERIVAQIRGTKFAVTEGIFREKHAQALRPILLGLGTAWTGVNLRDDSVAAKKDTLATDLVIACLPVGLNQTSTMRSRTENMGTHPVVQEALMMLRQGLGRIVRDEDMKDRHIWFMDGRIWNSWKGMRSFCLSVRRILGQYQQGEIF